jgi:hypothetical protein
MTQYDGTVDGPGRVTQNGGDPMTLIVLEREEFIHEGAF